MNSNDLLDWRRISVKWHLNEINAFSDILIVLRNTKIVGFILTSKFSQQMHLFNLNFRIKRHQFIYEYIENQINQNIFKFLILNRSF